MTKEEKLKKITEIEGKVRKFEAKSYKLMAELKEIEPYPEALCLTYANDSAIRTVEWCNKVIESARKWAYREK